MPDRWGRPTLQDGMTLANQGMGLMNQFRRNELYDKQEKSYGLGIQLQQKQLDRINREDADRISKKQKQDEIDALANDYLGAIGRGETLPTGNTDVQVAAGAKASLMLTQDEATQNNIKATRKNRLSTLYNEKFRPNVVKAGQRIQAGDMKGARSFIEEASKEGMPIPYNYAYDEGSGFFIERFRSDDTGEWEDNRHVTEEEALQGLQQIMRGDQVTGAGRYENPIFMDIGMAASEATVQGTREKWQNPDTWQHLTDAKGREFKIVPANSPLDYKSRSRYMLFDKDGNRVFNKPTEFKDDFSSTPKDQLHQGNFTMQELSSLGLAKSDLERKKSLNEISKGQADIAHTKAQTGKVYADTAHTKAQTGKVSVDTDKSKAETIKTLAETGKINAETANLPDKHAAEQLAQMRKSLGDALKPFHQKGKTLIDFDTGELTDEGNNAFNDAAALVQSYRSGQWKPANEADKTRLKAAGQAVGIYQQILQRGSAHIPGEDPEQRKQVDEIKLLIKNYGPQAAKRILNKRTDIRTAPTRPGVSSSRYGG